MDNMLKSAFRWLIYLLSTCLIVWAFIPSVKPIMLGIAAGLSVSAMNAFFLKRRVGMIADAALREGSKRKGMGFGSRIAMVLLLAMYALKNPDVMNLPAALAGSMVMPFLLLAAAIAQTIKENSSGKG
ncbi:ATP synthase subunit I [Paenibacillus agaridevorans]|nr:ATP synthase subunit I [Paenibacillus agaridevorans]